MCSSRLASNTYGMLGGLIVHRWGTADQLPFSKDVVMYSGMGLAAQKGKRVGR